MDQPQLPKISKIEQENANIKTFYFELITQAIHAEILAGLPQVLDDKKQLKESALAKY